MKKLTLIILSLLFSILLVGCGEEKYPPVESTEEEAKVLLTLKVEDKEYQVRYELYRALFLNNKSRVDGGDNTVWSSSDSQKYIDEINRIILEDVSAIYSVMHLAKEIGFDPYSEEVNLMVEDYIKGAVEGDSNQIGHGSYDAYLQSLKNDNLNYSVAVLMFRYALAEDAIFKYYGGEDDDVKGHIDGEFEYTDAEIKDYYYSSSCARILQAYFQKGVKTPQQMEEYRNKLLGFDDEMELAGYIIGSTMITESDLIKDGNLTGIMIGKTELYSQKYKDYVNEVFQLKEGELSNVITVENTDADGYYLVYILEKNDEHFQLAYDQIRSSYLHNIAGGVLKNIAAALLDSSEFTENYESVVHSDISMN